MPLRPILKALPPLPFPASLADDDLTPGPEHSATNITNNALPFACLSRIPPLDSPHVHFPPTPTLTRIEITHSRLSYDRKPILVSPNLCALPGRGERMFDYFKSPVSKPRSFDFEDGYFSSRPTGSKSTNPFERRRCLSTNGKISMRTPSPQGSDRAANRVLDLPHHTTCIGNRSLDSSRGFEANLYSKRGDAPPALIFDPSSESESDACVSPPADLSLPPSISHISTHFRGGSSFKLTRNEQSETGFIPLPYEEHGSRFSSSTAHMPLNLGKRSTGKYRQGEEKGKPANINSEKDLERKLGKAISMDNITGYSLKKAKSRTRNGITDHDTRAGTSRHGFESSDSYEHGLDGCLGGF